MEVMPRTDYRRVHINLTGDYIWHSSVKVGVGKFKPLQPFTNP